MNSYVQLISLVMSFIYGVFLYYGGYFNNNLVKDKNIIIKFILGILYIFNMSMIYVIFLYYLNSGVLHLYNVLFIVIGYIFIIVNKRK